MVRRIITSQDAQGRSFCLKDETIDGESSGLTGIEMFLVAGHDSLPPLVPSDAGRAFDHTAMPDQRGMRAMVVDLKVGEHTGTSMADYSRDTDDPREPGLDEAGFHQTDTVDIVFVTKGTVGLVLSDGEILASEGDCFVQYGPVHAWRNRGNTPAQLAIVIIGARRAG